MIITFSKSCLSLIILEFFFYIGSSVKNFEKFVGIESVTFINIPSG